MKDSAVLPTPRDAQTSRLFHLDEDLALGSGGRLLVIVWRQLTTSAGLELARQFIQRTCAGRGCEFALVIVLEANAKLPGAAERNALAAMLHEGSAWIQVSALVFEGSGFLAATIRSIVTGLTIVAHQDYPHRVFDSIREGARFIEREQRSTNPPAFLALDVVSVVSDLRRQVAERSSR